MMTADVLVEGELRALLDEQFPEGAMSVRYETWLWIATRL